MRPLPESDRSFSPPTAQQVRTILDRYPPRPPSKLIAWLPIIALAVALYAAIMVTNNWAAILPWLTVAAVFIALGIQVYKARNLETQLTQAQELAMLREHIPALRRAWRLLPSLATLPPLHHRTVAIIAYCLDQINAYDAALVAYDYLSDQASTHDPVSLQLRVQRAILLLATDRLTDADDALRQLRSRIEPLTHTSIAASYHLASLVQQVRTNHWQDVVDHDTAKLIDTMRPLGIDAGYAYALIALSHHMIGPPHDPAAQQNASLWWSRATLLLPINKLVARFDELSLLLPNAHPVHTSTPPHHAEGTP